MPTNIGILHSTGLTSAQTSRIQAGLANANWPAGNYTILPTANNSGKYGKKSNNTDDTALATSAAQLRTQGANIIIAAGGLVSALAAYDEAVKSPTLPVVCLIGRMPTAADTDPTPYNNYAIPMS